VVRPNNAFLNALQECAVKHFIRKAVMSNISMTARSLSRARQSVRESQIPIGREESGVKSNRHRKVLDRLRAEYKIRKIGRWVRKAVEFVPSAVLGWLKTVRASLNLKFRKGPVDDDPEATGGLSFFDFPEGAVVQGSSSTLEPPFPEWWTYWKEMSDHTLSLFRGVDVQDCVVPVWSPLRVPYERNVDHQHWVKPEALGGPHLMIMEFKSNEEDVNRKAYLAEFIWQQVCAPQYYYHLPVHVAAGVWWLIWHYGEPEKYLSFYNHYFSGDGLVQKKWPASLRTRVPMPPVSDGFDCDDPSTWGLSDY